MIRTKRPVGKLDNVGGTDSKNCPTKRASRCDVKKKSFERDVVAASGLDSSAVRLLTVLFTLVHVVRRRRKRKQKAQNTMVEDGRAVSSASSALSLSVSL